MAGQISGHKARQGIVVERIVCVDRIDAPAIKTRAIDYKETFGASRRKQFAQRGERHVVGDGFGIGPHQPSDRQIGNPAHIMGAANTEPFELEPPGRKGITESQPDDGRGNRHRNQNADSDGKVSGGIRVSKKP